MERKTLAIVILVLISGIFYSNLLREDLEDSFVQRVIDGDTLELSDGERVRLKGINTPESSMFFYFEATNFLRALVENKSVQLKSYGRDRYGRILAYVYFEGSLVNEAILREGLGTIYYYEIDSNYNLLADAEQEARLAERGIWKKSSNYGCLEIEEFRYIEPYERCSDGERVVLRNKCENSIDFILKDDATHIYFEEIDSEFVGEFSCIWNDAGDSLYVWDEEGLLIFYRY